MGRMAKPSFLRAMPSTSLGPCRKSLKASPGIGPGLRRVCPSCRLPQRRPFASATSPTPPPKPPSSGFAALPSRHLLSVSGPEAAKFLQGIVTANVCRPDGSPRTDGFYTAFLNATGRVMHDVFLYPFPSRSGSRDDADRGGFLVEADASQMSRLAKYVKRYKLRAKVDVRIMTPDEASVWHVWDDAGHLRLASGADSIVARDDRAPGQGYRIVQLNGRRPEVEVEPSSEEAYTVRRYLRGVPEGQDEMLREQALPLESNIELMGGIDFRKGCYVGQELTIRTKHRGVVRKRIVPCMVYESDKAVPQTLAYEPAVEPTASPASWTAAMIPAETSIGRLGKRGRSAGRWLKGVGNIGLALCRLEIMTDVVLPGEQPAATLSAEDEFELGWGEEEGGAKVKVKAFVPDWLRQRLKESQHQHDR
ncbi:aminomethyl transferase [Drechmeria coniospora]|uniref:Iron-sulfur cluster assembly factor IBA57 homolog, mitochondrial n=1 Tax=Drechmeria coniospora TaxID=98403 RepID=A0A151GSD9_DRECN|nr:aminomethyl transferase [Drechmeria coniospora]KYK60034.1 aminomethyl transferase [Drechmeria coniospora]